MTRLYHASLDQWGDVLRIDGDWVSVRFDDCKSVSCYEISAPYIYLVK